MPLGRHWSQVQPTGSSAAQCGNRGRGILAAIPFPPERLARLVLAVAPRASSTPLLLCNLGVLMARTKGWPHKDGWFKLGSWARSINILASSGEG